MNDNPTKGREPKRSIEDIAADIVDRLMLPTEVKGRDYLTEAIILAAKGNGIPMSDIFSIVAEKFSSTPERIERAMQHAINMAMDLGEVKLLYSMFGRIPRFNKTIPDVQSFVNTVVAKIRAENEKADDL